MVPVYFGENPTTMRILLSFAFLIGTLQCHAQVANAQYDFNNFNWHQNADGRMFYDAMTGFQGMEVPIDSDLSAIYSSSLWLGGINPSQTVNFTGQTYCDNGCSYKPGPLTIDGTAQNDEATAAAFNRFWSASQSEIDAHVAYYDCLNDPACDENIEFPGGYDIPETFLSWPAEGDTEVGYAANLAPYVDYNNDGTYNPEDGDHPAILGDFSTFCILNGHDPEDTLISTPTGYEVHMTVYGFTAEEGSLFNSLYVQYKVINRSALTLSDTYFGVFNDFDLGNPTDDRLGTDVARSTVYVYNGNETDQPSPSGPGYGDDLPVFGMRMLAGPLRDADGTDNQPLSPDHETYGDQTTGWGDGIPDNERLGLSRSISINGGGQGFPLPTTVPVIGAEFYNYMRNFWRDGLPLTYGGLGYNPSDADAPVAKYIYPGLSDPLFSGTDGVDPNYADPEGWTEEAEDLMPADRKSLCASGPFTFNPGDVQYLDLVYIFVRDSDYPDEDPLDSFLGYADEAAGTPWGTQLPDITVSVRDVSPEALGLRLYPNPARDAVTLESQSHSAGRYTVFDLMGKAVMQANTQGIRTEISVGHLPKGMYLIRYEAEGEAAVKKLVVE